MKPEQQQIAIAVACGYVREIKSIPVWEFTDYLGGGEYVNRDTVGYSKDGKWVLPKSLPDYLGDLNAMHEAEGAMLGDCEIKWQEYRRHLLQLIEPHQHELHATAAQRAEAFLKTLGLWKD